MTKEQKIKSKAHGLFKDNNHDMPRVWDCVCPWSQNWHKICRKCGATISINLLEKDEVKQISYGKGLINKCKQ